MKRKRKITLGGRDVYEHVKIRLSQIPELGVGL
jgi:hypothetical protein